MFTKKRGGHYLPQVRYRTCWYLQSVDWEVGRVGRLATSYTRTSTDSDSTLLSASLRIFSDRKTDLVWTRLVSSIHNSQFRCTKQNGTELPAKFRSSSCCCRYKSTCFLRLGVAVGSTVIGAGAHVATICSDWLWCSRDCGGSGGQALLNS